MYVGRIVTWRTITMGHQGQPEDKLDGWIMVQVQVLMLDRLEAVDPETQLGRQAEGEGPMSQDERNRMWMAWCWTHWLSSGHL